LPVDVWHFSKVAPGRWRIENACHWILAVVFREDDSRVRTGHAVKNLALIRRLALNLLAQEKTPKRGNVPRPPWMNAISSKSSIVKMRLPR